jgi:cAMP-regulated phosphoprotein/endosulfine conserved region
MNLTNPSLLSQERKYFDSGDYALSKAGKASDAGVTHIGSQHPLPENIPHLSSPSVGNNGLSTSPGQGGPASQGQGGSPVKEQSYLHRQSSLDENGNVVETGIDEGAVSPPAVGPSGGVPIGGQGQQVPTRWQQ